MEISINEIALAINSRTDLSNNKSQDAQAVVERSLYVLDILNKMYALSGIERRTKDEVALRAAMNVLYLMKSMAEAEAEGVHC